MKRVLLSAGMILLASVGLVYGQAPAITSVLDAASGSAKLCPGTLAVITGAYLGTNPTVTVGGKTAYNLLPPNNTTQMTIEIPVDAPIGATTLVVTTAVGGPSAPFPLTLAQYAPSLIAATSGATISPRHQASGAAVTAASPAVPGEVVVVVAIGLGPTVAPVPTGTPTPAGVNGAVTQPVVSVGSTVVLNSSAVLVTGQIALFQVNLTVPTGIPAGSYPISLSVAGVVSSNTVSLSVGAAVTAPVITSTVDAVSGGAKLCPGSVALITGTNLFTNPPVTVGGKSAFTITPPNGSNQIIIQIPIDAPLGANNVIVTTGAGGPSAPFPINLTQFAPVLVATQNGNPISPVHQKDGTLVTAANPAVPNETILFFAIGLGPTNPVVPTGATTPQNPTASTTTQPTVTLGGIATTGVAASLRPGQVAVYQVTFVVPASISPGNYNIALTIGGNASPNTLSLAVGAPSTLPAITSTANNYSYILNFLPNYGIAQGSIFDIFGVNLSNTSTGLQSAPLSATLQGVSVTVVVNGVTTHPLLYYVTPGQIAGILPSSTPVGTGTIAVTNNGQTGPTRPFNVVQSAFGILTLNGLGGGPAAAFDVNSKYLGYVNALNPGEAFVLWGTGVGPVTGDESVTQIPVDLTNVPFSVEVGGLPAQLYYHGRSQYPGLDQVIAFVPAGVTPGCDVSVVTRSGNIVSNFAYLPIAASGRTCGEATQGVSAAQYQSVEQKSSLSLGILELSKKVYTSSGQTFITDHANAQFLSLSTTDFNGANFQTPSPGSCSVYGFSGPNATGAPNAIEPNRLNAGNLINVTGPNGKVVLNFQTDSGKYGGDVGGVTSSGANLPIFIPSSGGTFTFDNGTGGPDVGAFTSALTLNTPVLTWTNQATISNISRTDGLTVSWSGSTNGFVEVDGVSISRGPTVVGAEFLCVVPASAGQFTIPASVMLSLPASGTPGANGVGQSTLSVIQLTVGQAIAIPKIDVGLISGKINFTIPVSFQ